MIRNLLCPLTIFVGLGAAMPGWAHHPRPTARPTGAGLALTTDLGWRDGARIDARVATEFSYFDRLLQAESARDGGGSLWIGSLVPSIAGLFDTGTAVQVRLPVGLVVTGSPTESGDTAFGLGDLNLTASQELSRLWAEPSRWLSVSARLQLSAPTGRYRSGATMSFTDVSPTDEGGLDVVTYDTQSSLGAGVWSAGAGLQVAAWLSKRVQVNAASVVTVPLSRTPDRIRWGRDVDVQLGGAVVPWLDVLALLGGVDYRWHDLDDVPDAETGEQIRVGGRHEVGVMAGLQGRIGRSLTCEGRVHWPVWQRAGGVQLVETVSARASCGYVFSL